mgnify:CR=1 FL=1
MSTLKITDASVEPVTLAEAKLHLRVDVADDDALITALITAARQRAEFITQRTLITTTWELSQDAFGCSLRLQYPRVIAVSALTYLDSAGVLQTLAPSEYIVDAASEPGQVVPGYGKTWPDTYAVPNAVKVRYTAGYGATAASVPLAIRQWMLFAVGLMYAYPEGAMSNSLQPLTYVDRMLDEYRIWLL